jgi:hypothetical protein
LVQAMVPFGAKGARLKIPGDELPIPVSDTAEAYQRHRIFKSVFITGEERMVLG